MKKLILAMMLVSVSGFAQSNPVVDSLKYTLSAKERDRFKQEKVKMILYHYLHRNLLSVKNSIFFIFKFIAVLEFNR